MYSENEKEEGDNEDMISSPEEIDKKLNHKSFGVFMGKNKTASFDPSVDIRFKSKHKKPFEDKNEISNIANIGNDKVFDENMLSPKKYNDRITRRSVIESKVIKDKR